MDILYGVCVGSEDKLNRYVTPYLEGALITRSGQTSIAAAYNSMLDECEPKKFDALILQHDDLEITDPDGVTKFLEALTPGVGLVGVAGGSARTGLAWWNADPIGHQRTDALNIDFGTRTGEVDSLEGSILVFSKVAATSLRFDTRFPGFHGYDEISMQAHDQGMRVVVADVDTWHHNRMGFKSEQSHREWLKCDQLFREKWGL